MSYFKAVFDTGRPVEEKVPQERDIHSKMSVKPLFALPPVPYTDFLLALDAQDLAIENAQFGGRERILSMRAKEKIVDNMVRQYRTFVTLKTDGDAEAILSSGFLHTKPRQSAGDMPKVTGVKNVRTDVSGSLKLRWNPVRNAGFFDVQVAEVGEVQPPDPVLPDPTATTAVEIHWEPLSTKPAHIQINGLKSLTHYQVRVRANGAKGFGAFSDVITLLVI